MPLQPLDALRPFREILHHNRGSGVYAVMALIAMAGRDLGYQVHVEFFDTDQRSPGESA